MDSLWPKDPKKEIADIINYKKKQLKLLDNPFDYESLVALYEKHIGKNFDYRNIKYEDIAPYKDGHYLQQLSTIIDRKRETNILNVIESSLNAYDKILVVYGVGHYLKHKPVLDKALGNAKFFSL